MTSCQIPDKPTTRFPLATKLAFVSIGLLVLLIIGSTTTPQGEPFLPLLARLAICELGFITGAIAAFVGCKADWGNCRPSINSISAMIAFVAAIIFADIGVQIWPTQ